MESAPGGTALVSAFLCVSLLHRGASPSLGVFTGAKLGVPGAGMVHMAPLEPRFRERRQRPGHVWIQGPGPVHGIGTESCEIMPVKD